MRRRSWKALTAIARLVLPWPTPHERKTALEAAQRERQRSAAAAQRAREIEMQIRDMAARNHFAEAIARQIADGRP